jgi:hypothetical protein
MDDDEMFDALKVIADRFGWDLAKRDPGPWCDDSPLVTVFKAEIDGATIIGVGRPCEEEAVTQAENNRRCREQEPESCSYCDWYNREGLLPPLHTCPHDAPDAGEQREALGKGLLFEDPRDLARRAFSVTRDWS